MTTKQTASILKVGFLLRYFSKTTIEQWAEKKILMGCENVSLIELSLIESKSNDEILSLIGSLGEGGGLFEKEFLDQYYLGLFNETLNMDVSKSKWTVIENEVLRYFSIEDIYVSEEQKLFVSVLNNDYSLRKVGYSGAMKMPDQLVIFLKPYNKFYNMQEQLEQDGISKPNLPNFSW